MSNYKYVCVANVIKEKILYGTYKAGAKLPSIVALSKELSVNAATIIRAYALLESEHMIYSVPKSGYYVVKSTDYVLDKPLLIDMLSVNPASEINPYKDFYHCMEKAISLYEHKLFTYSPAKGMPELISILRNHLTHSQVFAKEQDIFITTGAQQALFILSLLNFPNGHDTILVEQPTYDVMLDIIRLNNIPVVGIQRTENGLDLAELENILSHNRVKFFYLMPRFQNPTGFSYSNKHKKEILKLAKKYGVYIVEDDYLADLELNQKNDPIFSFDNNDMVIYIRSFSKTLLPGLRLGMAIIPKILQDEFLRRKNVIDLNSSVLSQGALEIYLRSSMYEAHIKRTKAFYKGKMDILSKECRRELDGISNCFIPPTGIFAYIEVSNSNFLNHSQAFAHRKAGVWNKNQTTVSKIAISVESLILKLEKSGLLAASTSRNYIDGIVHAEGVRLCVCKVCNESIPLAVQILKHELQKSYPKT